MTFYSVQRIGITTNSDSDSYLLSSSMTFFPDCSFYRVEREFIRFLKNFESFLSGKLSLWETLVTNLTYKNPQSINFSKPFGLCFWWINSCWMQWKNQHIYYQKWQVGSNKNTGGAHSMTKVAQSRIVIHLPWHNKINVHISLKLMWLTSYLQQPCFSK